MPSAPWHHPDSWLTQLLEPTKRTFVIASLVVFVLPVVLHLLHCLLLRLVGTKKTAESGFFLLGPSGAGSTSLLSSLEGEPAHTRLSRDYAAAKISLASSGSGSSSNPHRSATIFVPPGTGKRRTKVLTTLALALGLKPQSGAAAASAAAIMKQSTDGAAAVSVSWPTSRSLTGILFAVDASQITAAAEAQLAAEYLHDILLLLQWADAAGALNRPAVLVVANKTDLPSASGPDAVWLRLESEIELVRQSRLREARTMGAAATGDAAEEESPFGEFLQNGRMRSALESHGSFSFKQLTESGISVTKAGAASRPGGAGVDQVKSWIQGRL